jgi:flavine halogenase
MGTRLSENELQKSLDFCVNLFSPTSPEQHERVANSGVSKNLLDVNAPLMDSDTLEGALRVGAGTEEPKQVNGCESIDAAKENGLATIADDAEGELGEKGKPANPPPAVTVKRSDRRTKRSDSDAQKLAETKMVVNKINARRVVHSEYAINNLESEGLNGYVVRLEKGKLGLTRVRCVVPAYSMS